MARKRLTPPQDLYLAPAPVDTAPALPGPFSAAPIARIAGETTAVAAMRDLSDEWVKARAEGRLVQALPLSSIAVDHLIRDRVAGDPDEMASLRDSLRARGQQQPIDVVDLGSGRYGLISGWRRLSALQSLYDETEDPRFAVVQALLRRPDSASGAYLAMVEENEIRAGLSHYERARIAALAAEQGVFKTPQEALRHLFANASRAKRSKIGSFLVLHRDIGSVLAFPAAIPERLGLALAQALEGDATLAPRLRQRLTEQTPKTAAAEQQILTAALRPAPKAPAPEAPAIQLHSARTAQGLKITLSGPGVDDRLLQGLQAWLAAQV